MLFIWIVVWQQQCYVISMNPANISTAGLICEELQFLPSLVVLKELLGWQNKKKYIKEREEKTTWKYTFSDQSYFEYCHCTSNIYRAAGWGWAKSVPTAAINPTPQSRSWNVSVARGKLPSTPRRNWKWANKLLWADRSIFPPSELSACCCHAQPWVCMSRFPRRLCGAEGRMEGEATAWIWGRGALPAKLQLSPAGWSLNPPLICCTVQLDFNFPRSWRKGERGGWIQVMKPCLDFSWL